jgi:hypothetical protein
LTRAVRLGEDAIIPLETAMRIATLLVLLCSVSALAEDKPLPERWTLEYLPAKLPALGDDLYDKTWGHLPPRTRSGRGVSDFINFRKSADGSPAEVEWRQRIYPRAGQPVEETTRKLPLRIEKSLLEFGGELRTAAIHGEILALNVGVPVGERSWYLVVSDTFTDGKVRVSEYLFEFADDPRTTDKGAVTVKHASNLFPKPKPEKWEQPASFEVVEKDKASRTLLSRSAAEPGLSGSNLPKVIVWTDRSYLSLKKSNDEAIEYHLQK